MTLSLPFSLRKSRTVLLINDDGLSIFLARPGRVRKIGTYTWTIDNFIEVVADAITRDCGRRPVVIINDQVEQFYRKERMPPVSILDQARIVDRKLGLIFPTYPLRSALRLSDEKSKVAGSRGEGGNEPQQGTQGSTLRGGKLYLMAAAPRNDFYGKSLDSVRQSFAQTDGYCLLPVEACDMVAMLSKTLSAKGLGDTPAEWVIFIGQHSNGSLRQVVTRNGELALTRLTPVVDTDIEPGLWASEVDRELKGTLGYLARFGFSADKRLDIIVISNPKAGLVLKDINEIPCTYHTLTVQEAAQHLGIKIHDIEDDRYADILHAAWIGQKASLKMPILPKDMLAVSLPRRLATMAGQLFAVLLVGMAINGSIEMSDYLRLRGEMETATAIKKQLEAELAVEIARKQSLGININLMKAALSVARSLDAQNIDSVDLVTKIGLALPDDMRLDKIDLKMEPAAPPSGIDPATGQPVTAPADASSQLANAQNMTLRLTLSFPGNLKPEEGNQQVQALRNALADNLPDYTVSVARLVADLQFTGTFTREAGTAIQTQGTDSVRQSAEIVIARRFGEPAS